jgi:hypothetical protein
MKALIDKAAKLAESPLYGLVTRVNSEGASGRPNKQRHSCQSPDSPGYEPCPFTTRSKAAKNLFGFLEDLLQIQFRLSSWLLHSTLLAKNLHAQCH